MLNKHEEQKTVLITGGGRRIGAELAEKFSTNQYRVALHVNHSLVEGERLLHNLSGKNHILLQGDLNEKGTPSRLVKETVLKLGKIDCLVCNASVFFEENIEEATEDSIEKAININFLSPIIMAKSLWQCVGKNYQSNVVLFGDQKLINLNKDNFSYTLSRSALYGSVRFLAMTTAPRLRVNMVMPGLTIKSGSQTNDNFKKYHNKTALEYGNTATDIADTVFWLAENKAITGQVITVDGGQHLIPSGTDVMYKE